MSKHLITQAELSRLVEAAIRTDQGGAKAYARVCREDGEEIALAFLLIHLQREGRSNWPMAGHRLVQTEIHVEKKPFIAQDELDKLINAAILIDQGGASAFERACRRYGKEYASAFLLAKIEKEKNNGWLGAASYLRLSEVYDTES